jgi:2-polyprenyl-3-methyl-5-hydroxy-6-metoxy-1,4-benzoquinol methylase
MSSHNQQQLEYFEGPLKKTMVPLETPYVGNQLDRSLQSARVDKNSRILEIGCGMGRYTIPLARRGYQLEGQDLSPKLLDLLRSYAPDLNLPLHCGDIAEPNFEGPYDAVLGYFVLHHLDNFLGTFRALRKLLKPGGRAVFVEPNPFNPLYYFQIFLWPNITWQGEKGILKMRRSVLVPMLEQAGLRALPWERFGFFPPFLRNRPGFGLVERGLERIPGIQPVLPFQLIAAEAI